MNDQIRVSNLCRLLLAVSVLGLLALTFTPLSALATAQDYAGDFPQYSYEYDGSKYGVAIPYPENWYALPVDDPYWFVQLSPISEQDDDLFQDGVLVGVETVFPNTMLTSYVDAYIKVLEEKDSSIELLESISIEVDGITAYKITYYTVGLGDSSMYEVAYVPAQYQANVKIKVLEVIFIENERAYTINYAAERQNYIDHAASVEHMIENTKINTSTTVTNNQVSGKYANANLGLEIEFPAEWIGYETTQKDAVKPVFPYDTMVVMKPELTNDQNDGQYIMILSGDLQRHIEEVKKIEDEYPCESLSFYISKVNNAKLLESLDECLIDGIASTEKNYVGIGSDRITFISYSGTSDASFENGVETFQNSVKTLRLDNTIDLSNAELAASVLGDNFSRHNVTINDKSTSIETATTSQISKFDFSYDRPGVVMSIAESNPWGALEIGLDGILEGPYSVLIDDKPTNKTLFLVDTTNNNKTILSIEYPKGSHEITIIGTRVVPEFQIHAVAIMAFSIGLIVLAMKKLTIFR